MKNCVNQTLVPEEPTRLVWGALKAQALPWQWSAPPIWTGKQHPAVKSGECQFAASHLPSLIRIHCRSMEAHARLSKKGFNVASFGTGDKVRTRRLEMEMCNFWTWTRWSCLVQVWDSPIYTSLAQAIVRSGLIWRRRMKHCTSRMGSCTCLTGRFWWEGWDEQSWPGTGQSSQHLRGCRTPTRGERPQDVSLITALLLFT